MAYVDTTHLAQSFASLLYVATLPQPTSKLVRVVQVELTSSTDKEGGAVTHLSLLSPITYPAYGCQHCLQNCTKWIGSYNTYYEKYRYIQKSV